MLEHTQTTQGFRVVANERHHLALPGACFKVRKQVCKAAKSFINKLTWNMLT